MIINEKMWNAINNIQKEKEEKTGEILSDIQISIYNSYETLNKLKKDYIEINYYFPLYEKSMEYRIFEDGKTERIDYDNK